MRPEDVDAELVEKAARHRFGRHLGHYPEITWESVAESIRAKYLASAADYLAAVLPEIQAQALRDHRRRVARFMPAGMVDRATVLADLDDYAARLTATPEGPTDA